MINTTEAAEPSSNKAARLLRDAREAKQIRSYQTSPAVVALQVERIRAWSGRLVWTGIIIGLAFTMTNVQQFAAQDAARWSPQWATAWLLDPMVSFVLIGILIAEQVTARYQVPIGTWPRVAKWAALLATYTMNTWSAWADRDVPLIVLHSVPPLMVFVAVEAVPAVRDRLTEAVFTAERHAAGRPESTPVEDASRPSTTPTGRGSRSDESTPAVDLDQSRQSTPTVGAVEAASRGDAVAVVDPDRSTSTSGGDQDQSRQSTPADRDPVEGQSRPVDPASRGNRGAAGRGSRGNQSTPGRDGRGSTGRGRLIQPVEGQADLRQRLADAIDAGEIDPRTGQPINPASTESIRRTLGIGAPKARQLKHVNGSP